MSDRVAALQFLEYLNNEPGKIATDRLKAAVTAVDALPSLATDTGTPVHALEGIDDEKLPGDNVITSQPNYHELTTSEVDVPNTGHNKENESDDSSRELSSRIQDPGGNKTSDQQARFVFL